MHNEQVRVEPDCVPLTAFSVPWGTYVSNVLQKGDCNSPSTFQHVVTWTLREHIGHAVHTWIDDILVDTDSVADCKDQFPSSGPTVNLKRTWA